MARRRKAPKQPKYALVNREAEEGKEVYALATQLQKAHHPDLSDARIVCAWMVGRKRDADGHLRLGALKKASELDRELAPYDFILLLNREAWGGFSADQRAALVDHELCHGALRLDKNTEPVEDAHGRKQYRVRKHDIEEFGAVLRRHGLWKADLQAFAEAVEAAKQKSPQLFPEHSAESAPASPASDPIIREAVRKLAPKSGSGVESVTISAGGESVTLTQATRARLDAEKRAARA